MATVLILAMLVAVVVALPLPAAADETGPAQPSDLWAPPHEVPTPSPPAAWELPVATAAIAGANWLDIRSTQQLVAAGGREAWNPGLYGHHAERIVSVKLAVIAGEVGVFYALRKWRKEAAWTWVAVVVVGNILVAQRNARITDRLQAQHFAPAPVSGFQVGFSW